MPRSRADSKSEPPVAAPLRLPASATHAVVAWSGALTMLASCALLNFWTPFSDIAYLALIVMGCAALGIFVPDLLWQKVHRRVLNSAPGPVDPLRVATKYLGVIGSVAFVALLYWLSPEYYQGAGFYGHYYTALWVLLPTWAIIAPFYLYWVDRRMAQPRDSWWQVGRLLLGRWQGLEARVIWQHLLGWLVKGFFLPLMFTYFCDNLNQLLHYDLKKLGTFGGFYDWAYFSLYFIDVSMVSMTYLMSLKATDTHIRSTEPTGAGWLAALVCYQPFWSLISRQYINYDSGVGWAAALGGFQLFGVPWLYDLWAVFILMLVVIYVWATVAFGARFSNLTHRGIITNGPFRYTKHPAYLSKNLSWWLISMPFVINGSVGETVRRCILLATLNLIYYLRAKTEERHLSLDPIYVDYANWIDRHGALRALDRVPVIGALARWRPTFRTYTPPTSF
jgi:Isoprenylcysteine carboxyl methyltransferase (ICMT) family